MTTSGLGDGPDAAVREPLAHLARDSLYYGAAGAVGKALALLTVPFLSRALGASEYGITDLAMATAAILTTVSMFAGDVPAARQAAQATTDRARRVTFGTYVCAVGVLSTALALAILPAANVVSNTAWSSPTSTPLVFIVLLLVPISAVQAALVTVQRLDGRAKRFAVLATVDWVAQVSLAVLFVALGMGPAGALWGLTVGSAIGLVAAAVAARDRLTFAVDPAGWVRVIMQGLPFLPAFIAFAGADLIARGLVADQAGDAAVGALGVAVRLASVLALTAAAFQLAWGPRGLAMEVTARSSAIFGRVMVAYALVVGAACVALSSVGPELVTIISGSAFLPAAVALPGLAAAAAAAGSHFILAVGAGISGRSGTVAASAILGAVVQVGVTAVLLPHLQLLGVGIGAIVGRACSLLLLAVRVRSVFDHRLWTASLVLLVVGGFSIAIGWLNLRPETSLQIRAGIALLAAVGLVATVRALFKRPLTSEA